MRLTCPSCQAQHGADAYLDEARDVLVLIASVPYGLAPLVLRYLGLFRPGKQVLRWAKAADILVELIGVMEKCELQFNRSTYAIPPEVWRPAFEDMLDRRAKLGKLDSHGYLWAVLISKAADIDAQAEREREANRRRPAPGFTPAPVKAQGFSRIGFDGAQHPGPEGNSPRTEQTEGERREAAAAFARLQAMMEEPSHAK